MATYFLDNFTGTAGTLLSAHTPDTAPATTGPWTKQAGAVNDAQIVTGNLLSGTTGGSTTNVTYTWANAKSAAVTDFDLTFALRIDSGTGDQVTVGTRMDPTQNGGWSVRYTRSTRLLELLRATLGGSSVVVGSATLPADPNGTIYTIQMQARTTGCTVLVNGVAQITTTQTQPADMRAMRITFFGTGTSNPTTIDSVTLADPIINPPVNTVAPTVTGSGITGANATRGIILNGAAGSWTGSPTPTFAYRWQRSTNGGGAWSDIAGATSPDYTPVNADQGNLIRLAVDATNTGGTVTATSTSLTVVPPVPANTVAPAITGTPVVGAVLSCSTGTWTEAPTGYAYQWKRDGVNISAATAATYTVATADIGHALTCVVTATNAGGSTTATSNGVTATAEIAAANLQWRLSGGSANTQPILSLGGAASNTASPAGLFDDVFPAEATSGDVEYRAVYVTNTHPSRAVTGATLWISSQTSSAATSIDVGLAAQNPITTVADENTPPPGVAFSAPTSQGVGLDLGTLDPGETVGVWVRRTTVAGATRTPVDQATLSFAGTSAAGALASSLTVTWGIWDQDSLILVLEGATGNLTGIIAVTVYNEAGDVVIARHTSGIKEVPTGSGVYWAYLDAPATGEYLVEWDDGSGTYATTTLSVALSSNALTTLEAVRLFIAARDEDTEQDPEIEALIVAASNMIQRWTGCEFAPAADNLTRTFTYTGGALDLAPYSLRAVTAINLDSDEASPIVLAATDYRLQPVNPASGVYQWIDLRDTYSASGWGRQVSITGNWGFPTVPADVEMACLITVREWLRPVSGFNHPFTSDAPPERPVSLPYAAQDILSMYRTPVIA